MTAHGGRDSTAGRGRGRARPRRRTGWLRRWCLRLAAIGFFALGLFVGISYLEVRRTFVGRPPREPSRIYSDALTLTPGLKLSAAGLGEELEARGYRRRGRRLEEPGEYRIQGDRIEIHLRDFDAPGRRLGGFRVQVTLAASRIDAIDLVPEARRVEAILLEPRLLGGFYGASGQSLRHVPLADIPSVLVEAVLDVEDRRFRTHRGLDPRGLLRAGWRDLKAQSVVEGGSTITQQVLKNVLLGHARTWTRKAREIVMAPMLEALIGKDRILEIYLNEIYLGQKGPVSILGVGEAALFYFGVEVQRIELPEAALLAGLIRSPGRYNPWLHPQAARARRDEVLDRLADAGKIDREQAAAAAATALRLADATGGDFSPAGSFLDAVRAELVQEIEGEDLARRGLRVFTTMDTRLQSAASRALKEGLERLGKGGRKGVPPLEGAMVVMNPRSGAVLALVGGRDPLAGEYNRARLARRQVGSLFKPFVYLAALEAAGEGRPGGLTPVSLIEDEPLEVFTGGRSWRPANSDGVFRGPVTVRRALAESINLPAVRAAQAVGLDRVADLAEASGFPAGLPRVPALALGAAEATPLEVATAFACLAALGERPRARVVKAVTTADHTMAREDEVRSVRVVSPEAAYLAVDLMRSAVREGTGSQVEAEEWMGEVAGKTGTTNSRRDAWFAGFTPEILAVVWVGRDDNQPTGLDGATGALPIWLRFMREVGADRGLTFPVPDGIVSEWVDPSTGGLATARCPDAQLEVFVRGTEPVEECPIHAEAGFWRRLFRR